MHWFPNISGHLLRISISTEMLSETNSRNLLDFINLQDCLRDHLQATRSAWGWYPALLHGTASGSGPGSSQNLFLTSHQQPPLSPRPQAHEAQVSGDRSQAVGSPRKPPASLAYTTGSVGTTGHQEHTCLGRRGLLCCLHPC